MKARWPAATPDDKLTYLAAVGIYRHLAGSAHELFELEASQMLSILGPVMEGRWTLRPKRVSHARTLLPPPTPLPSHNLNYMLSWD